MRAALPFMTSALVLLAACKEPPGVDVDPRLLIPDNAAFVLGFEVDPIAKSALAGPLKGVMEDDPDTKGLSAAVGKCDIDSSSLRVTVAATADETAFMAALEAPGVGTKSMVRCLEKEFGEASGEGSGLIMFETKGKVAATPQEGGGYVIILNKHTLVVVEKAWEDQVFGAIENESDRSADGVLAKAVAAIPKTTDAWVAYVPAETDRADLGDIPGLERLTVVSATADFADGVQLDMAFDFPDAEGAGAFAETAASVLDEAKPELEGMSLPATLLDSATPKIEESRVSSRVRVSSGEIPALLVALGPMFME